jgi:hypothetical protein
MRNAGWVLIATALFTLGIGVIYWATSYEPAGTAMLAATAAFGLIPGVFLLRHGRDDVVDDVVGVFPESSVWPFVLGCGAAMSAIGLVFGPWASLPGLVLLGVAFVGGVLESRP